MALRWLWWRAWFPVDAVVAAAVGVAGVALGYIDLWRWAGSGGALGSQLTPLSPRLAPSASTWRGRRGTWRHGRALCVAGVALMALGWLWWFPVDTVVAAALGVAGVALGDIDFHFASQAWQAWHWAALVARLVPMDAVVAAAVGVAAVPLADIDLHFAWQAWHFETLEDMDAHFAWQSWHLALGWLWWCAWFPVDAVVAAAVGVAAVRGRRGRRGTWRHGRALCVARVAFMALGWLWWRAWFPMDAVVAAALGMAGVALRDIDPLSHLVRSGHLWHWAGSCDALGPRWSPVMPWSFAQKPWHLVR